MIPPSIISANGAANPLGEIALFDIEPAGATLELEFVVLDANPTLPMQARWFIGNDGERFDEDEIPMNLSGGIDRPFKATLLASDFQEFQEGQCVHVRLVVAHAFQCDNCSHQDVAEPIENGAEVTWFVATNVGSTAPTDGCF